MPQILPPKKDVALALLERASVFVHLDPRGDALVPMNFKKQPRLVLQIGLNMAVPIPDLRLDDHGMSCTLSFNRAKFHCVVPWPSVFALVGEDGRGMVWPDDVPREIAGEMAPRTDSQPAHGERGDRGDREKQPGERGLSVAPDPAPDGSRQPHHLHQPHNPHSPHNPRGPAIVAKKKPHVSLVGASRASTSKSPKKRGGSRSKEDKPALVSVPKAKPTPAVALPPIDRYSEGSERAERAERAERDGRAAERAGAEKSSGESLSTSVSPGIAGVPNVGSDRSAGREHAKKEDASSGVAGASPSSPSLPSAPSSPTLPSSTPPKKKAPKRELPPYLRVVK